MVQSVPAVIEAVEHGLGLGLVPEHAVEDRLARGSLVRVRTRRRELTNQVALLRLLDKVPSRSERALVRHLLATVGA